MTKYIKTPFLIERGGVLLSWEKSFFVEIV